MSFEERKQKPAKDAVQEFIESIPPHVLEEIAKAAREGALAGGMACKQLIEFCKAMKEDGL